MVVPDSADPSQDIHTYCDQAGWRQGSIIRMEDSSQVLRVGLYDPIPTRDLDSGLLVVLTQDCDIVHPATDHNFADGTGSSPGEPFVELVPMFPVTARSGFDNQCLNGRNPRRFVLKRVESGRITFYSILVKHRFRILKSGLFGLIPDSSRSLDQDEIGELKRWFARRYTRAAFPTEFNDRLGDKRNELEALWKDRRSDSIAAIFLKVDQQELASDVPYHVEVKLILSSTAESSQQERENADWVSEQFDTMLGACRKIVVDDLQVIPAKDFSLAELRVYLRYDRDYRSGSDRTNAGRPPAQVDEA